jgi:sortase (surface protein transpeptidase)
VATIAGHVDGGRGRPAVFIRLKELKRGQLVLVRDTRNGQVLRFVVTGSRTYSTQEAAELAVLTDVYGSGAASNATSVSATPEVARLALITCTGNILGGSYDQRLVVYARKAQDPAAAVAKRSASVVRKGTDTRPSQIPQ